MSDFVHILEDYKTGFGEQEKSKLEDEVSTLKIENKAVEDHLVAMEARATEPDKKNSSYLRQ